VERKALCAGRMADQKIDGASGRLHHVCIAARLRVIPWKLGKTAFVLLGNTQDEMPSEPLTKAELGSTHRIEQCILFVSRQRYKTRADKVRYWTAVARPSGIDLQVGALRRRLLIWSSDLPANILTLMLAGLSRSQVTLSCQYTWRIRPICKSLHTYPLQSLPS
jgi:hypothetical protein